MRIAAISDLHGKLPPIAEVPECDVLLIAGDICPVYDHDYTIHTLWFTNEFTNWLNNVRPKVNKGIFGTPGNHDLHLNYRFLQYDDRILAQPMKWLIDRSVVVDGVKIHGSPWSVYLPHWAWMAHENKLAEQWKKIDDDVDVLFVHGPAYGKLDIVTRGGYSVGSKTLRHRIEDLDNLKLFACGHIHEAYGREQVDNHLEINCSYVNLDYVPQNPFHIVDL